MSIFKSLAKMVLNMDQVWNEGGKVWFLGLQLKYLFCADIEKKEISIVFKLPDITMKGVNGYIRPIKYENKIFLLPNTAKDILIYNLETHKIRNLLIKDCEGTASLWCSCAGIVENKLYIIESYHLRRVMILDIAKEKISDVFDIKYIDSNDSIGTQSTIYKGCIYIPVLTREKIVSFDINTYEFREYFITGNICGCRSICHDDKYCWVVGEHYGIVRWNPDTNESVELRDIPKEFKLFARDQISRLAVWYLYSEKRKYVWDNDFFCQECFYDGIYVWVVPELSDSIVRIDTDIMQAKLFSFKSEYQNESALNWRHGGEYSVWGVDLNRQLRIVSKRDYRIYCIETETLSCQMEEWSLSENTLQLLVEDLMAEKVIESKWSNLETMIYCVTKSRTGQINQGNLEVGTKIYNSLQYM